MLFLELLLCAALIVLAWYVAKEFERIAQKKGHYEKRYFWWSFLVGILGYLMVIALPNHAVAAKPLDDELPDL